VTATPRRCELRLDGDLSGAGQARRFVADALATVADDDLVDSAVLAVSELVTNVMLHARTSCRVRVLRVDDRVRLEVVDFSTRMPAVRHYSPDSTTDAALRSSASLRRTTA
jgi:anti-sigma regulatory factor (Ser/Thr protein kinase)